MTAAVKGTKLYYETLGSGTPMLVMHGGLGWDHGYFRPGLDALAEDVELIYYDHRGNGRSDRDITWDEVDHVTWVEDADALREHLGHERIVLFGHSYGGFLAQEYALRFPERLAGLILCSTAPALDYTDVVMANAHARGAPEALAAVGEIFSGAVTDDERFATLSQEVLPLYFHNFEPVRAAKMFASHSYSASAFSHAFARCVTSFDTRTRLEEIRGPTLLISGDDDWIMPLTHALERLHRGIPHAEVAVLKGVGHFPFVEAPELFASTVRRWLSAHAPGGPRRLRPC